MRPRLLEGRLRSLRARQQRNFLATLLLSQGVPMILGRTQEGNNNAWCQDSEISWFDWERFDTELHAFVGELIALRRREPVFRRRDFLTGDESAGSDLPDVMWLGCDGGPLGDGDWSDGGRALAVFLNGEAIPSHDREGNPIEGRCFLIMFNAHHEEVTFTVPSQLGECWAPVLDTNSQAARSQRLHAGDELVLTDRSLTVLVRA